MNTQEHVLRVRVIVAKEPSNEADPWTPPSASEVAEFVRSKTQAEETDDGWYVVHVESEDRRCGD